MCGIAGVMVRAGARPPDRAELCRMAAMLQHRGPDGHGFYVDPQVGLAHTRLSLLDLDHGHQPLANEDGTLWIVANGEIFGHAELRAELQQRGHRFRTRSDTEVILHAYEEWGASAWSKLDGQFAFALWHREQQHLWLVRDRFGIVPLHYAIRPDAIVFASEAKAIFAGARVPVTFAPTGLTQSFTQWAALPPHTVFAGVQTVMPGAAVCIDAGLRRQHHTYWQLDLDGAGTADRGRQLVDSARDLRRNLEAAVSLRLQADVPVATYLSGGIDSSVITALAARQRQPLHTFSLRFTDPAFDETAAQREVAAHLGTQHHEVLCGDGDIRACLPDVVWHCEAPLLRTAPVPMYLLSALVRRHGIKAVLTGEGADELLGGYSLFLEDRVRRFLARDPGSPRRARLLARIHDFVADRGQRDGAMWRAFYGQDLAATDDPFFAHRIRWRNSAWTTRVLSRDVLAAADRATDATITAALHPRFRHFTALGRAQATEVSTFLSPYLLASQGDRVTLGNGVEARYPFLDPHVVQFCAHLPDTHKLRGLRTKIALRELAGDLLPPAVCHRPKRPYRAPTASALLAGGADDYQDDLLRPQRLRANPLIDATAATLLLEKARRNGGDHLSEREAMALVGLLTLQLLSEQFGCGFQARLTAAERELSRRRPTVDVLCTDALPGVCP